MSGKRKQPEREPNGRCKEGSVLNPSGKGGFQDHPEHRINGHWDHRSSYSWNLRKYLGMTTAQIQDELQCLDQLTQAEKTALMHVVKSQQETDQAFRIYQDIADRTEGKPRISMDATIAQTEPPTINILFKGHDDQ